MREKCCIISKWTLPFFFDFVQLFIFVNLFVVYKVKFSVAVIWVATKFQRR